MQIGVPREIKDGESRVALTPNMCRRCVQAGASVLIEKGAGSAAGFSDAAYRQAGAAITPSAKRVWASSELVLKVKEPLPAEYALFQSGQALFTYLHLAACPALSAALLERRILGIAYEAVQAGDGSLPLLKPMSQIAGRLSIQIGAHFLQSQQGGSGVLLGGIPGAMPGHVTIIGAGNSGAHACRMAHGMGARVTVLDIDSRKLELLDEEYRGGLVTLVATPSNIEHAVALADLVVGAVLIPGAKAPVVLEASQLRRMRPGSVIVDIAIDQGGCIGGIRPTSHHAPTYTRHGVIHYAVPNMPALVAHTATLALTQATESFVVAFAAMGISKALQASPGLQAGVATQDGVLVKATPSLRQGCTR